MEDNFIFQSVLHCIIDIPNDLQLCLGHGLVLQHFRQTDECGGLEELEPIDSNLKYDFNYQVAGLEISSSYELLVSII